MLLIVLIGGQYAILFVLMALHGDVLFESKKQFWLNIIPFYWLYEMLKMAKKHYNKYDDKRIS